MSILNRKDIRTATSDTIPKLLGHIHRGKHEQLVAATLAATPIPNLAPADHDGQIEDIVFVAAAAAAAGESMVIDVTVNGVTILSSTFTYNSTQAAKSHISLRRLLDPAKMNIRTGDVVRVVRTYTAGGGPTPMGANCVIVEYAKASGA